MPGYTEEPGNDITRCLEGLPDFKTGSSTQVGLPNILKTKWSKEGTLSAKQSKYASSDTVTGYISTWLAEWVREFGVDGFRCDTAKHVELEAWGQLKTKCKAALKEWKSNNPTKKLDDLDFWMTGECWNHKVYKDGYYTTGGFDSMINFDGTGGGILASGSVGQKYNDYANAINNDDSFNVLTYISSHDTTLARSDDMYYMGSAFLMLPGGVQIYYGDETARPKVSGVEDDSYKAGHCLRSDMNWSSYDKNLVKHWGIVGNFRKNHIAVGAGANVSLTATSGVAFGRTYSKNGLEDKVAAVIGAGSNSDVTVDVSSIWSDGTVLENYYDESTAVVSGGKVTFNSGAHGTILIQEPDGERGRVVVTHIDQDTGKTIKTVTLSGLVGDSYTAEALDTPGFAVARVVGSKTGTFAKDEASVTFYYTFDSNNYAYIVVKHVDASTGAELADSETQVGKIGTTYTTSSKDIKNYECDESLTTNSTGTVVKGTTTVTYKYNYVEPKNLQVHYYNSNSWSAVNMYAYTGDGASAVKLLGEWPGKAMTSEGDGWFFCEVPDNETAKVLFNNGNGAQEPGSQQPGYELTGEVWLKNGKTCPACKVNVKYVSTDGKVLGTEVIKGIADGTATYTTTAKTFSGYTLESTPANATGKFTEGTISVVYTYKSTEPIYDTLINNTSVSASTVKVGNSIKMTGTATGGSGSYTYKFYYKKSS
ncbi:MAG: MucBP domain-containing protein, partial [Clostridia bacterium]|nr:MucBP domain-containing protein [Clostridia bacterium]